MRRLLHLLTLLAMLVAPIAAPAAASVQPAASNCEQMGMGAAKHRMPAGHHRTGEACCIAVPPAIDPPLATLHVATAVEHPSFIAVTVPFRLGAGPKAEDPPPRTA